MAEFQVVVMAAGSGSRMYPLTEGIPKALLPVANRPLIWHSLKLLESTGFQDIIVVAQRAWATQIYNAINECKLDKIVPEVIGVDAEIGTADSLRIIREKIKKDFIVVSCDLISDVPIHLIADLHRQRDASVTMLVAEPPVNDAPLPDAKAKKAPVDEGTRDFIGIDAESKRLLYFAAEADVDEDFKIRKAVLMRYPRMDVTTKLLDGHFYIFRRWILDFLMEERHQHISAIKGELIPFLVRKQFSRRKRREVVDPPSDEIDLQAYAILDDNDKHAYSMSSTPIDTSDAVRCHVFQMKDGFCARVNTLASYLEINRNPPKLEFQGAKPEPQSSPSVAPNRPGAQTGSDSIVKDDVVIGDKSLIKKTIVGSKCKIGANVKLVNCLLMDNVTVQDGCNLQSVVVCTNAVIQAGCTLRDCQVGFGHTVPAGTDAKNEALVSGQGFE
ncbi:eukaryotic translation initiation factor 2B [Capsaspora owczarzaki ATCC 30864]|uniref:eukaryotic translation initiation factor 2B n=1 Tax=Capsaspora owczarzaki (strain ATCC 30864) TaxID=595528 RepID=UPI0003521D12|nr:eukaryotic translation initiation factor 2B [Capsaspora owczarzaki ATCC 30864]|eukprot:XP_004363534.2 eukaryotic translation initiation factor 2B [Capsaspora owczarzaki ATCC 30864]